MNQAALAARLTSLDTKVAKIGGETSALVAEVAALREAVIAAGEIGPEVMAALEAVEARVTAVDDLVADPAPAPTPEAPAPEPAPEPAPAE